MAEPVQTQVKLLRPLNEVLKEIEQLVTDRWNMSEDPDEAIKDLRWKFDQVSATMNQAIYNDQHDKIHETCLATISVLIEMLART